jgi:hypothetical protein
MRAPSYVAILVAAGVCVVSVSLIVLSLAGGDSDHDEISLQTSVVLEIKDNPAATPAEKQSPTGADPTPAAPSTSPPSTSHLSTGTGPIQQMPESAPAEETALDVATAKGILGKSGQAAVAARKAPAKRKSASRRSEADSILEIPRAVLREFGWQL